MDETRPIEKSIFHGVAPSILGRYFAVDQYAENQFLFREGDPGCFMGIVLTGEVEVYKGYGSTRQRLALIPPTQPVGEMAMLDEGPRSATALAKADCKVLILRKDQFSRMREEQPMVYGDILTRIVRAISLRMRETNEQLYKQNMMQLAPSH